MLRKTVVLLAFVAFACHAAPMSDDDMIDRVYKHILVGDYEGAVDDTVKLESLGKGELISQLVRKLIDEGQRNLMTYAYDVYVENPEIVKDHFPLQFRMILEGSTVKLINKRDNLALKLTHAVDSDGDRTAYGDSNDKTSERISWKFIPSRENEKIYFKILNIPTQMYLKSGVSEDSVGDHWVYGSSVADGTRHQWYLVPAYYEGDLLFYIYNRAYNQALKLGRDLDRDNDRQVYTNYADVIGKPELFGFYIKPL